MVTMVFCLIYLLYEIRIGLKFKEDLSKVLHLEYSFVWCGNLDTSESRLQIP